MGALATPCGSSVGFMGSTAPSDEAGVGTNLRDLLSCISTWMNERVIKKPQNRCFFGHVGHDHFSRSFTLWVVKEEKSLPGCPAHREMQNKGIASGISQILQDFGFLSKHEEGEARENAASEWKGGQHPHQSALPRLALALVGAKTSWLNVHFSPDFYCSQTRARLIQQGLSHPVGTVTSSVKMAGFEGFQTLL